MKSVERFLLWFNDYVTETLRNNERRLVVLSGSDSWAFSLLSAIDELSPALTSVLPSVSSAEDITASFSLPLVSSVPPKSCLIFGDNAVFAANVQKNRFRDKLGSESDFIIFADSKFTVDAFAALSGTLKAGGILFLVIPLLDKKIEESLFFKRIYSFIHSMPCHTIITESESLPLPYKVDSAIIQNQNQNKKTIYPLGCITEEQYGAVQAIEKVISGHRKRPLVLTADRGRGKSSALAIACAQLMKTHKTFDFSILITAPDIQSLTVFYRQLRQSLRESLASTEQQGNTLVYGKASLHFIAVDQLIKQPIHCNLLLVDEAAAIPVFLLEQLLGYYHRIVFASTVHGYEGAGRSFTLKFQKTLDRLCPQWRYLHINEPIRWRKNDPLEQLVFNACLLNAELPTINETSSALLNIKSTDRRFNKVDHLGSLIFKIISATELVADELLLQQIFAILVTAHYQTKPSDLQLLLDNPQVQVACLYLTQDEKSNQKEVIAVALLMNEGKNFGVSDTDILDVINSKRRLRNHFIPQSLLSHSGFETAFDYQYLRIMRIAVHPGVQQQGVGSYFINEIELLAKTQGADFIGASFGANNQLLAFWLNANFTTVRIGFTKDKASGEHSALVIKALNHRGKSAEVAFNTNFYRSFDYLLLDEYKSLSPSLIHLLLSKQLTSDLLVMSELDLANVNAYSTGERLFSSCAYSLYLWFKHDLVMNNNPLKLNTSNINRGDKRQSHFEHLLIARLMQKHDIKTVCQQYGYTGKKSLNQAIKSYISLRLNISYN